VCVGQACLLSLLPKWINAPHLLTPVTCRHHPHYESYGQLERPISTSVSTWKTSPPPSAITGHLCIGTWCRGSQSLGRHFFVLLLSTNHLMQQYSFLSRAGAFFFCDVKNAVHHYRFRRRPYQILDKKRPQGWAWNWVRILAVFINSLLILLAKKRGAGSSMPHTLSNGVLIYYKNNRVAYSALT
jgi:hypothetical protein